MNKMIIQVGISLGCLAGIITSVIFYNQLQTQKEKNQELTIQIEKLDAKFKASESNNEKLKKSGEKFIQTLLTYDNKSFKKARSEVLELAKGKGKDKLLQSLVEAKKVEKQTESDTPEAKYVSDTKIKDSYYNRKDEKTAMIVVNFDHNFTVNKQTSATPYTAKVWLTYDNGKWIVEDYELQQLL